MPAFAGMTNQMFRLWDHATTIPERAVPIKSSNDSMIDHEPPRTARTELLSVLLSLNTLPKFELKTHALLGPGATEVDDQ